MCSRGRSALLSTALFCEHTRVCFSVLLLEAPGPPEAAGALHSRSQPRGTAAPQPPVTGPPQGFSDTRLRQDRHGRVNPSSYPRGRWGQRDGYCPVPHVGTRSPRGGAVGPSLHRSPAGPANTPILTTAQPGPLEGKTMLPRFWPALSSPNSFQSPPQRRLQAPSTPQTPVSCLRHPSRVRDWACPWELKYISPGPTWPL